MEAIKEALYLLLSGNPEVYGITVRTLLVSGVATAAALIVGVPLGYGLAQSRFPGRTLVLGAMNTGMGMPPVVVGLVIWLLLVRSGPFGGWGIIYTKWAMMLAQFVIATPLIAGVTAASIQALPPEITDLLRVLGASPLRRLWLVCREARLGLFAALMAAFGAVVSEVGASMTVGGNLRGDTRVLTTAIVTETSRGETGTALALGIILLGLAFVITLVLTVVQQRQER
ncbi:MAG: ABC transporter permease [Gemmatimonadota bacterium]